MASGLLNSQNIEDLLKQYGIVNPTPAEIAIFTGLDSREGGAAGAAMAEYANALQAEQTRQANDPLAAYQTLEQQYASDSIAQAQNLYGQLQDLQSSAPKLFGEFTPDQINQYLAPLQTAFNSSVSQVQGVLASRGLGASSTEANALDQTNQQFQENVLQTGLNIGLTSQQNQAQSMQQQIQNLFGLGTQANSLAGQAAGQRSSQDLSQSNLIASLPYFLRSSADQEIASQNAAAAANKGGFQKTFNQVTGDISQGFQALLPIASTATFAAQKLTGQTAPGISSPAPATPAPAPATPAPAANSAYGQANYGVFDV